jgi:hypothetical protein
MIEAGDNGASSSAEVEGKPGAAPRALATPATLAALAQQGSEAIEYTGPLPVPFEGGYIQHRPHVFLIFWGSEWNAMPGNKEKLTGLYRAISGSSYAHTLTQYFDFNGYFSGEVDLTSVMDASVTAPPPAYPEDVRSEVSAMIAGHPEWGPATYENQYVVVTPPGTPSTFIGCAYHQWSNFSYTYLPWPTEECIRGLQPWGAMQVSLSHEWAESTTDPIPVNGYWGWNAIQAQGEIADVCNTGTLLNRRRSLKASMPQSSETIIYGRQTARCVTDMTPKPTDSPGERGMVDTGTACREHQWQHQPGR